MAKTKLPSLVSTKKVLHRLSVISVFWCLGSGGAYAAATSSAPNTHTAQSASSVHENQQADTPRIIAAGGSVTEIIYALGRGDWVVATDSTSMFPAAATEVTKLGYFRQLSTEGVLAQQPSLLLGASATGPEPMLEQVAKAGVDVHVYHVSKDIDGLSEMVFDIGHRVSAVEKAEQLVTDLHRQVDVQQRQYSEAIASYASTGYPNTINALFVVANNDRGITVAGAKTVPQALFDTLGMTNIASDLNGYKLMDAESVLMRNPDVVFAAGHMLHGENALSSLCSHHAIAATFAGQHCLVKAMDSSIGLGLSPRFAIALKAVAEHGLRALSIKAADTPMQEPVSSQSAIQNGVIQEQAIQVSIAKSPIAESTGVDKSTKTDTQGMGRFE
ncbi:hemin ABC transporter substrate-binding protein [Alteromonas sp. KS69]|uniref:heme/hemin ABC transporter substrate-binding protein n=1 Tax=Alteromonas sp. KS69 TaxID=2109917 RepID=UPI000F888DFB|nr:ABC transporter substrate-binding protein [Alteromonas sp. KS69]RUP75533.1 hemin ABC transporter substrate-binding protein [Alteromonas sp. KS69]